MVLSEAVDAFDALAFWSLPFGGNSKNPYRSPTADDILSTLNELKSMGLDMDRLTPTQIIVAMMLFRKMSLDSDEVYFRKGSDLKEAVMDVVKVQNVLNEVVELQGVDIDSSIAAQIFMQIYSERVDINDRRELLSVVERVLEVSRDQVGEFLIASSTNHLNRDSHLYGLVIKKLVGFYNFVAAGHKILFGSLPVDFWDFEKEVSRSETIQSRLDIFYRLRFVEHARRFALVKRILGTQNWARIFSGIEEKSIRNTWIEKRGRKQIQRRDLERSVVRGISILGLRKIAESSDRFKAILPDASEFEIELKENSFILRDHPTAGSTFLGEAKRYRPVQINGVQEIDYDGQTGDLTFKLSHAGKTFRQVISPQGTASGADHAMLDDAKPFTKGGIDLGSTDQLRIDTRGGSSHFDQPLDSFKNIQFPIDGLSPIIFRILPVNLPLFLGGVEQSNVSPAP